MTSRPSPILIVDDDPDLREALVELVECLGYPVVAAGFDDEALGQLEQSPCALLVSCDGADMRGCDLIRRARELAGEAASVPVLAVTAAGDGTLRERCLAAGADEHLARPVASAPLAAWLGRHVPPPAILDERMVLTLRRLKLVEHLYTEFIAVLPGLVETLRAEIAAGDRNKIRRHAHRLRGSAAQIGAAALARALQAIEGAARGPETSPIAAPGADFDALVDATIAALRAELAAAG